MTVANKKGVAEIAVAHSRPDIGQALLMEAIGTADIDFWDGLIRQLANAGGKGTLDERDLNFMLAIVKGIEPRDQIEAMLAAQMAAVHNATMTFAGRLNRVDNIPQQDSAERAFNKLARTFAAQVEALKRYRTGGQQKVTVEHVTVNAGGQAIVGSVQTPGGGPLSESEDQPHGAHLCTWRIAARHDQSGAGSRAGRRLSQGIASAGCMVQVAGRHGAIATHGSTAAIQVRRSRCGDTSRNWRGPLAS